MRNVKAREKRIRDWATKNKIAKGIMNTRSSAMVRFIIPELELGTVVEEGGKAVIKKDGKIIEVTKLGKRRRGVSRSNINDR